MTEDTVGGRWKVSYSHNADQSVTVSKWRADVHFPDPERPYKITVGVMFNALADNGMPDLSIERELLDGAWNDLNTDLPRYGAVLVLSVTGGGNREWVAYAPSHDWLQTWAPGFAERWFKHHTCQISAAEDPDWTTYRSFSGRLDTAEVRIYILFRNDGGKWLPFYVGQTTNVAARIADHFRAGRLGPGTRWAVLETRGMPEGGPAVGTEQIATDLFGRKNLGRGCLENEIDALANPRKHRLSENAGQRH
jgi:hypothetical protein